MYYSVKMSLMNESFPDDELFSENKTCEDNVFIPLEKVRIVTKNSNFSTRNSKKPILRKHQSVGGLNINTSDKYKHVTSKVKQYIQELEAESKRQKPVKKFARYNSLPIKVEEADITDEKKVFSSDANNNHCENIFNCCNHNSCSDLSNTEILCKCCLLVKELRAMNEYLKTTLDNKIAQEAKLKRNFDLLQIENIDLQQKVTKQQKTSFPEAYVLWCNGKSEQSTQTDPPVPTISPNIEIDESFLFNLTNSAIDSFVCDGRSMQTPESKRTQLNQRKFDEKFLLHEFQNICNENSPNLRLRSNSNDAKKHYTSEHCLQLSNHVTSKNGSDSAIESEDEIYEINDQRESFSDPYPSNSNRQNRSVKISNKNSNSKNRKNKNSKLKKHKKLQFLKKSILKTIFGSCRGCQKENWCDESVEYTEVNTSETALFESESSFLKQTRK